ncbi:unnamed protein product [Rotaria sp. Silwood2]|nr:unnamed protein product [Rotaria sp. Silwood2]CAF2729696.1 unnamed protein product [Rotaria sp. Silwood2]CAF3400654.1 unnamed protein product [Rotaria sp. Silwood2]CAF4094970.1 unnamed protein product [Rotaria sp. Silwood2]CAF4149624.1 unnamed protein product [Rotaria sp. Silwood2]
MTESVLCHICGHKYKREYINVHEQACLLRWHIANAKLPENLRRPASCKSSSGTPNDVNLPRYEIKNTLPEAPNLQLVTCQHCGRSFSTAAIHLHLQHCK